MNFSTSIVDEVRKINPRSRVLFTTYKFNQYFFERHIFPHFQNRSLPLLLVDYTEYQNAVKEFGASRLAETRYLIESVKLEKAVFHPKIVLASSDKEIRLIITSANLTPQGYATNAEIVTPIVIPSDRKEDYPILSQVLDFLTELENYVESIPHRFELEKLVGKMDLPKEYPKKSEDLFFIHNLREPLSEQIKRIIGSESITKIIAASRYFSQDLEFYNRFMQDFTENVTFVVQHKNNDLPVDVLSKWEKLNNLRFDSLEISQDRSLHGKIVIFYTDSGVYCLTGSANLTQHALFLSTKQGGNIETCLLRKETTPNHFDYLFKNEWMKTKSTSVNSIETCPSEAYEVGSPVDFHILEAKIIENKLWLKLDKPIKERVRVKVFIKKLNREFCLEAESSEFGIELSSEDISALASASAVSAELEQCGVTQKSDLKLIHNPQYLPEQYAVLTSIINEDERIWLFKILTKYANLPSLNYILPIIDRMEDYGIFESDPIAKEELLLKLQDKLSKIKPYSAKDKLVEIIEKFRRRHERRVKCAYETADVEHSQVVISSFIMINKLILWLVSRGLQNISYLKYVRYHIEKLCEKENYIKLLEEKGHQLTESKLLYHVMILACLVDSLQTSSVEFMRENFNPTTKRNHLKDVFDETFVNAVFLLDRITGLSINVKNLEEIIKDEYLEVTTSFSPSGNDLIQNFNRMIKSVNTIPYKDYHYPELRESS